MIKGVELSHEVAESITLATLIDSRDFIQEDIDRILARISISKLEKNHYTDLVDNFEILLHIKEVIRYFKG